jgi:hypothetical protein
VLVGANDAHTLCNLQYAHFNNQNSRRTGLCHILCSHVHNGLCISRSLRDAAATASAAADTATASTACQARQSRPHWQRFGAVDSPIGAAMACCTALAADASIDSGGRVRLLLP